MATYLYYCAGAGEKELPWLADITLDRALIDMQSAASTAIDSLASGDKNGAAFGLERVPYFADRGRDAILTLLRLVPEDKRTEIAPISRTHTYAGQCCPRQPTHSSPQRWGANVNAQGQSRR